jgi:hypothetical protein
MRICIWSDLGEYARSAETRADRDVRGVDRGSVFADAGMCRRAGGGLGRGESHSGQRAIRNDEAVATVPGPPRRHRERLRRDARPPAMDLSDVR